MRLYIEIFVQEEALSSMRTRTRTRHVRLLVCRSVGLSVTLTIETSKSAIFPI